MENCAAIAGGEEPVYPPLFPFIHEKGGDGPQKPRGKGRWAWVWGILGSLLSAGGFIALTMFEQYSNSLTELHRDLNHFNEVSGEFVKKENFKRVIEKLTETNKELQLSAAARAQVEKELETSQQERRELDREIQKMRERLANVEGRLTVSSFVTTSVPDKK